MLFTPRSFGKKQKKSLISEINYPPTKDRWVLKIIIMKRPISARIERDLAVAVKAEIKKFPYRHQNFSSVIEKALFLWLTMVKEEEEIEEIHKEERLAAKREAKKKARDHGLI